ncbi:uncharacterized protein M421DRAFT_7010 [Didymella exigua CBS 183.55]|uniref:G-protein coupled receptors family 1 profile domain-containing protein n=1 Tax=Didymella exigua CBS 183.55 TaxID=1150837 RepID=A0A6A5RLI3_9PLEO|nr:uncharacterized protein M421DRAFT_7010 [Didymella exigua CBS 183.55]KAF1926397.1 hypothetical protein M421DRAFT_7010 [Didymella exigua CBS 183.55]
MAGSAGEALSVRDNLHKNYAGEHPRDRTIFAVVSLFFMMILSLLLGARFNRLRESAMILRNVTSIIVLILYFLALAFIFSSAIMLAGQGLFNHNLCFSATWICLILYTACKGTIYIFIVERIHAVRAPFVRRTRDWLYWSLMAIVVGSFFGVAINAYLKLIIKMQDDGRCHMGIPGQASIPFMVVDISVNAALTGVFFYLLRPVVNLHGLNTISGVFGKSSVKNRDMPQARKETAVQRNIRILLWKSLFGSMLITLPTIANMVQFYITGGRELALICLSLCVVDVSWDAVVIHWLTFGSAEAEKEFTRSTQESLRSMRVPTPGSLRPKESQEVIMSSPMLWRINSLNEKNEACEAITPARMPWVNIRKVASR